MSFDSLGLSAELLHALADKGYSEPTPIQTQAIPVVLSGRDILAGAQTGTGKTAGFTLPLLQRLQQTPREGGRRVIRALILTPTRELAAQVEESVRTYGKHLPLKSAVIFGGVGFNPQVDVLRRGIDILVATPGRLLDHVSQKTIDLSTVEILVLDEADRMLDMGFIRDIRKVLALLPAKRQNLLFSATFSDEIKQLADGLLDSPVLIEVARRNTTAELITQVAHPVDRERKRDLLSFLISDNKWQQVLVFTRTKHGANRLAEQLSKDDITAAAIHGNKSQSARTRALADFKKGAVRVLVATDIAARGLDIDQLPHVVNYELPNVPEDYVHRIGRTGRAGKEGEAVSLVCVDERDYLRDIERLIKREIPKVVIAGFEPDPSIRAEPISHGRGQRRGNEGRGQGRRDERPRQQGKPRHEQRTAGGGHGKSSPRQPEHRGPRQGGQRFAGQPAAPRGHHERDGNTHRPVVNGNVSQPEVDGNRVDYVSPRNNPSNRSRPGQPQQGRPRHDGGQHRSQQRKGPRRGGQREVPALLDGNRRDD